MGDHFKGRSDVVIAKMDATANDVPDSRFKVAGFPTLYVLSADGAVSKCALDSPASAARRRRRSAC